MQLSHEISTCYNKPLIVMPGQFVTFDLFTSKIEKTYFQNKCHDFSYTYPTCIIFVACNSTLISVHLMGSMYPLIVYISWSKYPTKWNIVNNLFFPTFFITLTKYIFVQDYQICFIFCMLSEKDVLHIQSKCHLNLMKNNKYIKIFMNLGNWVYRLQHGFVI